ncbi:class I SAM-dependent methyltransferase [Caballeronia sp. BCC1704]|uniref:class I SAM-dependent methyltransferase n=1 Tax=Caballeronia sp. BCC1704 TaxID=2676300 RepID=UPI00158AC544|nr:class I SAM-dependent methyltransferase [Caballeronia sp. BCC1704]
MSFSLERSGYRFDAATRVWRRRGYEGIAYSDGDAVEERIGQIVAGAADVSLHSAELTTRISDWPSLYHLSSGRANVLRPFEAKLASRRVLEIGAGCGAISRYLGEAGADLLALEGSPRRAAIAASRSRDLPNVHVVTERFDDFRTDERFDVVTLIGVLEYASLFTPGSEPAVAMLRRVRDLLAPGGIVIVAIENQVGLKYFAGAPEDHVGVPMFGIEDRYGDVGPRTFGKGELTSVFQRAAFAAPNFLAPFPDYKFPVAVVSERGFSHPAFEASALAVQTVHQDPQLPTNLSFILQRAWPTLIRNGLGMDVANSFIVVASAEEAGQSLPKEALAYYYNTTRRAPFCKEVLFRAVGAEVVAESRALYVSTGSARHSGRYRFLLNETEAYAPGRLLADEFVSIISKDGWTPSEIGAFLRRYLDLAQRLVRERGHDCTLDSAHASVPGCFLDLIPQNIVLRHDGLARAIDLEWQTKDSIELGFLLFRAMLSLINRNFSFSPRSDAALLSRKQLFIDAARAAGMAISDEDFHRYAAEEGEFQSFATGRDVSEFLAGWADEGLPLASTAPARFTATVYYGHPDVGFSDSRTVAAQVSGGPETVRLTLPPDASSPSMLRIDPSDRPAWYQISSIEVLDDRGILRWTCALKDDLVLSPSVIPLRAAPGDAGLLIFASDNDPQMLPVMPADIASQVGAGWALEMRIRIVETHEIARRFGDSMAHWAGQVEQARAGVDRAAAEQLHTARALRDLSEQLAASQQRVLALEARLAASGIALDGGEGQ